MKLRETTSEDLIYVAEHTVSRGCSAPPEKVDFIYTLVHDSKILGAGGLKLINPTTAWCWVDITDEAQGYMTLGYRVIKEWLDELIETHKLKRLMAAIETDFEEAIRMVEHLGFERESTMPYWRNDNSAYLYVRIQ